MLNVNAKTEGGGFWRGPSVAAGGEHHASLPQTAPAR
jgi:hypothetical protein